MKFPKQTPGENDGRADARLRLDEARGHELVMEDVHEGSRGSGGESGAATALAAAKETTAAREAWVAWVERDY